MTSDTTQGAQPKDGGPAFPTKYPANDPRSSGFFTESGMSLRDYFAAHAPAVHNGFPIRTWKETKIVPTPEIGPGFVGQKLVQMTEGTIEREARFRYAFADAMLAARSAKSTGGAA